MDALSAIDVFSMKVFFFFEFCPMRVHPCAHVCIFNEKTKGKFPEEHHVV